ncbi:MULTISPECIES: universal stress protein [unclassified Kribbella]|uniref:universal stress protein n=1 Tax=unclassified Kribbella TaxID=2644121 RepID=UPI00301783D1
MRTWTRTGPVVVEVDGSAEGLRVVDYAALEAIRSGTELVLAAPYPGHSSKNPTTPGDQPKPPAELADASLRIAVAHVRYNYGYGLPLTAVSAVGSRLKVLSQAARNARVVVVGRTRTRGPHRLVAAQANIFLAVRADCPVIVVPLTWKPSELDRRVAVGIDGTSLSTEAVGFAFGTAADREGGVIVVHAAHAPRHDSDRDGVEQSWVRRADVLVAETLAGWTDEYPEVKVTRYLTARPVVEALLHEGAQAGLVVLGARAGLLPVCDPVTRRTVAAMTGPVAIVPHHLTPAEPDRRGRESLDRREVMVR